MTRFKYIFLLLAGLAFGTVLCAQDETEFELSGTDTISPSSIKFTPGSASFYLESLLEKENFWSGNSDEMRYSLQRLINHANEPFDSISDRLSSFQPEGVSFDTVAFTRADTLRFTWLNDSTFIFSNPGLERDPFIIKEEIREMDRFLDYLLADSLPSEDILFDSVFQDPDTIRSVHIDSLYLDSMKIQLYSGMGNEIFPPLDIPVGMSYKTYLPDSAGIVFSDTTWALVASENSPFYILPNDKVTDSLNYAIEELLLYTAKRDSLKLLIADINGRETPIWIGLGNDHLHRFWVKNYRNDSITIWMGNPARNSISLYLEDEVNIDRLKKRIVENVPITLAVPSTSLAALEPLKKIPVFWEYDLATSIAFSQTLLSKYWAKGGQSSISSMLDVKGEAKYNNTKEKQKWISSGRLKYGSIFSGENGLRTNTDIIEINSQFNKVIKGKFDFSSVFYMKNQIAKGYNYPNDSVPVSKFLNPGTFTVGLGVEYKPVKHTVINFSPLSYKNTFVLDTAVIDQTKHGIEADKQSKQELGGQLVMKNKLKILNGLELDNSLRMFANYSSRPFNVDFDWEINLRKQITWFFAISANFHTIYDKDILFLIKDDEDQPVLLPDGSKLKEPRLQFMEFVGISVSFKF